MVEVFALQIDFGPSQFLCETPRIVKGRFPPRIFPQIEGELCLKFLILSCPEVRLFQFNEGRHQCLGSVAASEDAEMSLSLK